MKERLLCVKLGGSIITDKNTPYKPNIKAIKTIARALKQVKTPLLVGHGSGSFGHTSAKKYGGKHGYNSALGLARVAKDAMDINKIVMDIFIEEGLPAISFQPRSFLIAKDGELQNLLISPILEALSQGFTPVVYGDIILDTKWQSTIFSGETTLGILCRFLQKKYEISKIIELCNVDGVLDSNQKIISRISAGSWKKTKKYLFGNKTTDVTGGMEHKIENALEIAGLGIETVIINGNNSDHISKAIEGRPVGTVIS